MDSLKLSFPLTFADQYRAYRAAFHRKPAAWLGYAFFVLLPPAIALAALFTGWTWQEVWAQNWHLLIGGPLFGLIGVPLLHRWNVSQYRRRNRSLDGDQSFEISRDGLRTWGPLHNTSVLWSGIESVVETRHDFLIYVSSTMFYFVPKSAFPKIDSMREFRALVRTAIGDRARVRDSLTAA